MSSRNKHDHIPEFWRKDFLPQERCHRRNCKGALVDVYVRYYPDGPLCKEKECTACQKVQRNKDSFYKKAPAATRNNKPRQFTGDPTVRYQPANHYLCIESYLKFIKWPKAKGGKNG